MRADEQSLPSVMQVLCNVHTYMIILLCTEHAKEQSNHHFAERRDRNIEVDYVCSCCVVAHVVVAFEFRMLLGKSICRLECRDTALERISSIME